MKARLDYIDNAKGIAILAITIVYLTNSKLYESTFYSLFKVVIFFMIVGIMTYERKNEDLDVVTSIKKRCASLMIPYFFFSTMIIFIRMYRLSVLKGNVIDTFKSDILDTITLNGIGTLWFLPALFVGEILFILVKNKKWLCGIGCIVFPVSGWAARIVMTDIIPSTVSNASVSYLANNVVLLIGRGFIAVWFILIGYLLSKYILRRKYEKYIGLICLVITIMITLCKPRIALAVLYLGEIPLLFFLGGITGSIAIILICKYWVNKEIPIVTYFGRNSLVLMATQTITSSLVVTAWKNYFYIHEEVGIGLYIEAIGMLLMLLLMTYAMTEIINKNFPIILGRKGKRK